jgi:hypothetical protein
VPWVKVSGECYELHYVDSLDIPSIPFHPHRYACKAYSRHELSRNPESRTYVLEDCHVQLALQHTRLGITFGGCLLKLMARHEKIVDRSQLEAMRPAAGQRNKPWPYTINRIDCPKVFKVRFILFHSMALEYPKSIQPLRWHLAPGVRICPYLASAVSPERNGLDDAVREAVTMQRSSALRSCRCWLTHYIVHFSRFIYVIFCSGRGYTDGGSPLDPAWTLLQRPTIARSPEASQTYLDNHNVFEPTGTRVH